MAESTKLTKEELIAKINAGELQLDRTKGEFESLVGADLGDAYLRGADLGGAYLRGAYLRDAYLGGADLGGADLRDADLGGAYLGGADLRDAYLRDADLRGADLRDADLRGADLGGADLRDAKGIAIAYIGKYFVYAYVFENKMRIQAGCRNDEITEITKYIQEAEKHAEIREVALLYFKAFELQLSPLLEETNSNNDMADSGR